MKFILKTKKGDKELKDSKTSFEYLEQKNTFYFEEMNKIRLWTTT